MDLRSTRSEFRVKSIDVNIFSSLILTARNRMAVIAGFAIVRLRRRVNFYDYPGFW